MHFAIDSLSTISICKRPALRPTCSWILVGLAWSCVWRAAITCWSRFTARGWRATCATAWRLGFRRRAISTWTRNTRSPLLWFFWHSAPLGWWASPRWALQWTKSLSFEQYQQWAILWSFEHRCFCRPDFNNPDFALQCSHCYLIYEIDSMCIHFCLALASLLYDLEAIFLCWVLLMPWILKGCTTKKLWFCWSYACKKLQLHQLRCRSGCKNYKPIVLMKLPLH